MPSLRDIYNRPDSATSPLTTKGDILVRDVTNPVRLPIGSNDQLLVADSTTSTGVRWAFVDTGFSTVNNSFTIPAVGSNVTISVSTNKWVYPGMFVYIQDGGLFYVVSKSGSNSITVRNESPDNNPTGSTVGITKGVVPAGKRGTDGNNSYTTTTANFTVPASNSTVTISVVYTAWVSLNQIIYISGAGYFSVSSKTNNSLTILNLGYDGNAVSGVITSGAVLTTAGVRGLDGITASTTTTANFTQPAINNLVTINVGDSRWVSVGQDIYIQNAGAYLVAAVTNQTTIQIENLGSPDNVTQGTVITSGRRVSPSGKTGLAGTNAVVTNLAASFTQPASGSNRAITVGTTEFLSVGSVIYINVGGYYRVISIDSPTALTIQNLGTTGNAAPSTTINSGTLITPAGLPGANGTNGANGADGANGLSVSYLGVFATAPSSPSLNNVYRNSTTEEVYLWNGSSWVLLLTDGLDGMSGHLIQNKGISLAQQDKLNFKGDLVNATNNTTDGATDVTIASGLTQLGDLLFHNGTALARLPRGTSGQILTSHNTNGLTWIDNNASITIQEEGVALTSRSVVNFTGNLVTATDNSGASKTDIAINLPSTIDMGLWTT